MDAKSQIFFNNLKMAQGHADKSLLVAFFCPTVFDFGKILGRGKGASRTKVAEGPGPSYVNATGTRQ